MEKIMEIVQWVIANKAAVTEAILAIIGAASVIVKITPTLKDDNALKGIIKFIGRFIALDKYGPNEK
jgi:hypothetical protein